MLIRCLFRCRCPTVNRPARNERRRNCSSQARRAHDIYRLGGGVCIRFFVFSICVGLPPKSESIVGVGGARRRANAKTKRRRALPRGRNIKRTKDDFPAGHGGDAHRRSRPHRRRNGLPRRRLQRVSTAAGDAAAYSTVIEHLQIGGLVFSGMSGVIIPDMEGDTVLLGMNALEHLYITQHDGELSLRAAP